MYICNKICNDRFGTCKKSFSWLDRKVNKKIDAYGHDADDSGMDLCPWLVRILNVGSVF